MLYYIDKIGQLDDEFVSSLLPYLSSERLEYQSRYRFSIDRTQSILAYILLRIGLAEDYGIFEMLRLEKAQTGKPYLADFPEIYFNLSHCKKGVACGVAGFELGVDIQDYVPFDEGIAKQFMTLEEIKRAKSDASGREFTRIWALKESYGKWSGDGICYDLTSQAAVEGIAPNGMFSRCYMLADFALSITAKSQMQLVKLSAKEVLEKCKKLEV
ncbi:MAG: 4'-phosphopantetheinyl transferase superfamily protein [Ruminococcaceae bacterium]|nr:4'-phosphopantetheinyl transferase superfamily protein [Oscillospiraceae bacterium]